MYSDKIITLMVVDTRDSRLLVESPPVRNVTTGMVVEVGQLTGVISLVAQTYRGSVEYEMATAFAGRPLRATCIRMPWDPFMAK